VDDTSFQPAEVLAALERHGVRYVVIGGLAATLHGSPLATTDTAICPARDRENLERLARALNELRARIRTADAPGGLPFACDATFLSRIELTLNLTTRSGDVDLSVVSEGPGRAGRPRRWPKVQYRRGRHEWKIDRWA
jgi:hypothetical protein